MYCEKIQVHLFMFRHWNTCLQKGINGQKFENIIKGRLFECQLNLSDT